MGLPFCMIYYMIYSLSELMAWPWYFLVRNDAQNSDSFGNIISGTKVIVSLNLKSDVKIMRMISSVDSENQNKKLWEV